MRLVWVLIVLGCGNGKSDQTPEQPAARSEPAATIPRADALPPNAATIEVTGRQLYEEYEASVDAADTKYKDKPVRVHGIVKSRGSRLVVIMAPHENHINAWFTDENAAAIHRLKPFDEVLVRCTGDGKLDVPTLRGCALE